jgi:predicted O-methyltransferase YrrM
MVTEDRSHRSHELNPRRHPTGGDYQNESKNRIWTRLKHVALLSDAEMRFIHDVPALHGDGDYANLGHSRGGSAILMADCVRENGLNAKIYSVDLFPTNAKQRDAHYQMDKFNVDKWIELCPGSTDTWAKKLEDRKFNFVFIDADHTYEAVKKDFNTWAPMVKSGGWIAFHDTNQDFSHRAVEETAAGVWEEMTGFHVDRIRTFQKP